MAVNKVILMGRVTATPELKSTTSGTSVLSFSLAVDRRFTGQNGERATDFLDCVAWRGTAEFIAKYFKKGDMIAVCGEIHTRTYTDNGGNKRKAVEIVIDEASFCGGKSDGNNGNVTPTSAPAPADQNNADGDDLPF